MQDTLSELPKSPRYKSKSCKLYGCKLCQNLKFRFQFSENLAGNLNFRGNYTVNTSFLMNFDFLHNISPFFARKSVSYQFRFYLE